MRMCQQTLIRLCLLAVLPLGGCCTIGPNDNPGGPVNYIKECYGFIKGN
jgi:hypothetical protein